MEIIIAAVGIILAQIIFGQQILQSYRSLATKKDIKEAIANLATKKDIKEVNDRIEAAETRIDNNEVNIEQVSENVDELIRIMKDHLTQDHSIRTKK